MNSSLRSLSRPEIGLQNKLGQMEQEKGKAEVVAEYLRGGVTLLWLKPIPNSFVR